MTSESTPVRDAIPFRTAVRAWFAISLQTFGGPAGQIAVMQRTLVDDKRWIGQRRFLHAMNYCMLLPGPEAQQLATYVGWLLHGTRGGLVAGGLFVLPGVVALLVLSAVYVFLGAYRDPGALDPWAAAVLASLLVTWVTFVPSFLFVLLGAPYMERLRGNRSLSAALAGITAAVVGVIANLGVYFAVHTLFARTVEVDRGPLHLELPDPATLRPVPLALALLAAVLLFRLRWSVLRTLGVCAL